ncbi:DUF4192 domain-containing protein [Jiangella asiatica]|uniref:DUF4192 domain-containing protein n=1 Tax=Jiangella asiatica TaxID=2530372 RepID=A0A4R5DQZ4_9ACTN|nr:DUF4192 domain-containing protein [Jiangella asiatica]TDE13445.1 DUF4192 domain-containing protein [Jiangella asiatica]
MNLRERPVSTIRAPRPSELLPVVPHLIGFHPRRSLVVLCLAGTPARCGQVFRFDLPPRRRQPTFVAGVVQRLEHLRPEAVVLVCYDDSPPPRGAVGARPREAIEHADDGLPRRELVDPIVAELGNGPVAVVDALLVRDGRWWSFLCTDSACCPSEGTTILAPDDPLVGRLAAEEVLRGRRILGSREELAASIAGPAELDLTRTLGAFARVGASKDACTPHDATVAALEATFERFLTGRHELDDDEVARICLGLADETARDAILRRQVDDARTWLVLLTELARRTPDAHAAPVCATLAWVAVQSGEGALANVALDRALAADPAHRLARLLRCGLDRQVSAAQLRAVAHQAGSGVPP